MSSKSPQPGGASSSAPPAGSAQPSAAAPVVPVVASESDPPAVQRAMEVLLNAKAEADALHYQHLTPEKITQALKTMDDAVAAVMVAAAAEQPARGEVEEMRESATEWERQAGQLDYGRRISKSSCGMGEGNS